MVDNARPQPHPADMSASSPGQPDPRLAVDIAHVRLATPVLMASGTCGYGEEYADVVDYRLLGGLITKSVTREPRAGNPPPRIAEVEAGILNAIGLANVGLERFVAEKLPFIEQMPTRVFVNVAGHSIDDYVTVARRLDQYECIAGIELNVSCPNVADGLTFGTDAGLLEQLVRAVKGELRRGVLIVKLSPNVTDITATAHAAIAGGADCLSLTNTFIGMEIDIDARRPVLANVTGGLSGPAIRPLALYQVHRVYREVAGPAGVPIIGMGGITSARDALAFMLAGATAVAVGTALFIDPAAPLKIAAGIGAYLDRHGLPDVAALTGRLEL